jgi:hypothetical protein
MHFEFEVAAATAAASNARRRLVVATQHHSRLRLRCRLRLVARKVSVHPLRGYDSVAPREDDETVRGQVGRVEPMTPPPVGRGQGAVVSTCMQVGRVELMTTPPKLAPKAALDARLLCEHVVKREPEPIPQVRRVVYAGAGERVLQEGAQVAERLGLAVEEVEQDVAPVEQEANWIYEHRGCYV